MHPLHTQIFKLLQTAEQKDTISKFDVAKYLGNSNNYLNIKTQDKRNIVKNWAKSHTDIVYDDFIKLLDSLNSGRTFQEKSSVAELLTFFPHYKKKIDPFLIDRWLDTRSGWGEVDSLCQSTFPAEQLLAEWSRWEKLLKQLVIDKNMNKRRAALVLLTKPVSKNPDPRLKNLAFEFIQKLQPERHILITKAISWLLRDLTKNHPQELREFLEKNKALLPAIAYREAKTKLETGKKYVKKVV